MLSLSVSSVACRGIIRHTLSDIGISERLPSIHGDHPALFSLPTAQIDDQLLPPDQLAKAFQAIKSECGIGEEVGRDYYLQ